MTPISTTIDQVFPTQDGNRMALCKVGRAQVTISVPERYFVGRHVRVRQITPDRYELVEEAGR